MHKQRSSRVQGSWAALPRRPQKCSTNATTTSNSSSSTATTHGWAGKQGASLDKTAHTFQAIPSDELKSAPKVQIIRENGKHALGETARGSSILLLDNNFLEETDANWMFETLLNEINWKTQRNTKYGTDEPRLTEWFSDYSYSYSGVVQTANSHWHPLVTALCDRLNEEYHLNFNSVLANYYRDGHDSVDWHTDSEPSLGDCPPIASISFGDTRNFELREMPKPGATTDFTHSQQFRVPLTHGSLLLMLGATQHDWQHRIPKEYHDRAARINLTFRVMYPRNENR